MSDLTAFHDAITDQDINTIGDTDLAMAAIDKAFDAGQADTAEQGVATPSDNNRISSIVLILTTSPSSVT